MELLWFALFAVLLIGYFALEGFDLGVGLLLPLLGRTRERRDRMIAAMAPFVLANEVWLVAVAGTLAGVYPEVESRVIPGLYPLVTAALIAWIARDAGLWFRRRLDGAGWRAVWDAMITLGSLGLTVTWGLALYALATGFTAPPLHPFGLALAAAVTVACAFHGWTFLCWRAPGLTGTARTGRGLAISALGTAAPAIAVVAAGAARLLSGTTTPAALSALSLVVLPLVPVLAAAQLWVWRTFGRDAGDRGLPSFF
ncbi:hypothetical protein TBS_25240 [Thermobispora bispora]|uniref:cytochrome d ubiquinol oxidase subunit II n=1 Tax=Thermobispora bispora TaxID=2006 RepID=UPI0030E755CB